MVYGYYYKTIKRITAEGEICDKCGANSLQYYDVMCRVNHIMYIPFLPSNKIIVRKCDVCGITYDLSFENCASKLLVETKYPKRYYIAPLLFVSIILASIVGINIENRDRKNNMLNKLGIGYTILEKEEGYKTSMLIIDISNDTVFVRENTLQTKGDIYRINEMENYDLFVKPYTKSKLQEMVDDGIITDIVPTTLMEYVKGSDFYNDSIQ